MPVKCSCPSSCSITQYTKQQNGSLAFIPHEIGFIHAILTLIGASLSKPHTDKLYGDLPVCAVRPFEPWEKVLVQCFGIGVCNTQ